MTAQSAQFDAKSARTRQPMPLWARAFDRATKEQGPEVIGAYMLILMAMWEAKSCDLPADEKHLSWVAKVSPTIWRRKYAPIIIPLLSQENGRIFSKKLQENAKKTEEYCTKQHERKSGKFEPKPLNADDQCSTVDETMDETVESPLDHPKQLTINTIKEEEDAREASFGFQESQAAEVAPGLIEDLRHAVGVQRHDAGPYWSVATVAEHIKAWRSDGLTDVQIISEATASRAKNPDPPDGPKALDRWMQAAAKAKRNALIPEKPIQRAEIKPPPTQEELLQFYADWVNGDRPLPPSTINNSLARALLEAKLVTIEQLKKRGVAA